MAMITCPECATEVSSLAVSCPKCGAPVAQRQSATAVHQQVTTTEPTAKSLKKQMLLSCAMIIVGIVVMIGTDASNGPPAAGMLLTIVGLGWLVTTRIRTWWHHG